MFVRELVRKKDNKLFSVSVYNATLGTREGKYVPDDFLRGTCSSGYFFQSSADVAMNKARQWVKERLEQGYEETQESLSYRHFETSVGKQVKFWNIRIADSTCVINYGSPGRNSRYRNTGTWQTKFFDSHDEALAFYFKSIAKKLKDGYSEQFKRETEYSAPPKTLRADAPRKSKPSRKTSPADLNQRQFIYNDDKSHKFWNIQLDGKSHTVRFGRVGTDGQARTKEFADEAAARKSFDKLIAEKTGKGYVEQTTADTAEAPARRTRARAKAPAIAAPESPPEPPPVVTGVTHVIDLEPRDWFWAMWRDPDPLPPPLPPPFDREACLESIRSVKSSRGGMNLAIPKEPLTPQEAEFWLMAIELLGKHRTPNSLCDALAEMEFPGNCTVEEMQRRWKKHRTWRSELVAQLLGPKKFADLILSVSNRDLGIDAVRTHALPYLGRKVREKLRRKVGKAALAVPPPKRSHDPFPTSWALASVFGCHKVVESLLNQTLPGFRYSSQQLIWGLGSVERVEAELDRRNQDQRLWLHQLRGLLAHTEARRLDLACNAVIGCSKGSQNVLAEELALVKDPAAAPIMLELRVAGAAGIVATRWLDEQLGNAVTGLVPVAAGKGQLSDAAKAYLREKQRLGFGKIIEKALKALPKDDAQRLRETTLNVGELGPPLDGKTTPKSLKPLFAAAETLKPLKGSEWAVAHKLPQVSVGEFTLSPEQLDSLLRALQHSEFGEPHPLLAAIRKQADSELLAEFAWALFDLWLANEAPTKHRWAMRSLGFLGNDDTALKLAPLVRKWPGESQHPRAVLGLECLRAIGSEVALMQLSGIANKVKFKALQKRATECVAAIADEQGMTRDELEDRVVPDCGLDETGSRTFDFGPRTFHFALDGNNKPVVRDSEGKLRKDLPKPAAKDDREKATQSIDDWKLIKKQIREVVKVQTARLEQALITGRHWSVTDFETLLVRHPLMTNFVRRLLWAGFDKGGKVKRQFRVTEECDYSDADDRTISLAGCETVGLVHPLHLQENECAKWGELFSDYELIPPFPQLARPVHRLSAAEQKQLSFERFEGLQVPAHTLLGILNRNGWARGMPQDNGIFREHYKHFPTADLTASIHYEYGMNINFYADEEDQTLKDCLFLRGEYKPWGWPQHKREVKLGSVDPVIISEVMSDLVELESKAV